MFTVCGVIEKLSPSLKERAVTRGQAPRAGLQTPWGINRPGSPDHRAYAEMYSRAQYEACDMISGRIAPELGGTPEHLDVVGVNFYPHNQWYHNGNTIPLGHHAYKPFSHMLAETFERYGRPVVVAETGAEGSARAAWLHYVLGEVTEASEQGVHIEGVCLYPILDIPGWTDERTCPVGLFSTPGDDGTRELYRPLQREIAAYQRTLEFRARSAKVAELVARPRKAGSARRGG